MKRYIMEAIGAALLTVAVSFTGNPLAIGFMLATLVYIGGNISGGHYNPAVTITHYMRGLLHSNHLLGYILAQIFGATAALGLFSFITKSPFLPELSQDISPWISAGVEFTLTALFCLTILTVVSHHDARKSGVYGLIIGISLAAIGFIGGLFNPAIATGSLATIFALGAHNAAEMTPLYLTFVVHVVSPLVGGAFAAWLYRFLHSGE